MRTRTCIALPGSKDFYRYQTRLGKQEKQQQKMAVHRSESRVAEADGPSLHLRAKLRHISVVAQACLEILQLLALLLLYLQGDLAAAVQELGDLLEVVRRATAGGH